MTRVSFSGDYEERFGQTKEAKLINLETKTVMTPLHFLINENKRIFNLWAHMRARDEFPYGIPIMDGSSKCGAGPAVEAEKEEMRKEAKKPPLQMIIQAPDPHGTVRILFLD